MDIEDEDKFYEGMNEAMKFRDGEMTGWKIIDAVKNNDVDEVKRLLNLSVEEGGLLLLRLVMTDKDGKTALQIAEERGYMEIVKLFKKS